MDSMEKFEDDHLPPKEAFFSKLHNAQITDEYAHAQNVWQTFNIQNMREYHDLYLKSMTIPFNTFLSLFSKSFFASTYSKKIIIIDTT